MARNGSIALLLALCAYINPLQAAIDTGTRPAQLVADMAPGTLREQLQGCTDNTPRRSDFSIGHRGAPLGYPEHTRESYLAAAAQGAGLLECDVTFTRDRQLVCRHAQCDLHTTTDILATELADKCRAPFTPAVIDDKGKLVRPATAQCCTNDLTLEEFQTLRGKRDRANRRATTVELYMAVGDEEPRYGELLTHAQSIALFDSLGVQMIPELKGPEVPMPFEGFTQQDYASAMIEEYRTAKIDPQRVWPQSFDLRDVLFWLQSYPQFGRQSVYLDGRYDQSGFDPRDPDTWQPSMTELRKSGVNFIAPPLWKLLALDDDRLVPSTYAREARAAGLELMTWTLERSGSLKNGGGWYFQTVSPAISRDGDIMEVLHVLARDVGVRGVFSDWPATVTYYDNCMDIGDG